MKFRNIILTVIAAMMAASCDLATFNVDDFTSTGKNVLESFQTQIDALADSSIPSVDAQIASINATIASLQKTDDELKSYIEFLEKELDKAASVSEDQQAQIDAIKERIAELQKSDEKIRMQIELLEAFVTIEISQQKDWANATFATLDQFNALSESVADLKERLKAFDELEGLEGKITEAYEEAIKNAVAENEESMKKWINEQLTGYYTIKEAEAKLKLIEDKITEADAETQKLLDEQKQALEDAQKDLKAAYEEAIETAINELEGRLNAKIAENIVTMNTAIEGQIDTINGKITLIKQRLEEAEAKVKSILARVQSIIAVPDYSDGSVKIGNTAAETISFDVMPAGVLDSLVNKAPADFASNFKFVLVKTHTKGADAGEPSLTVSAAKVNSSGQLELTVDATKLGDAFIAGTQPISASLVIDTKDGFTSRSSEYFGLYYVEPVPVYTEGTYSGKGIKIGDTWWAPVNCGYDATHTFGLLYQWGRKYGQPYENGTITPTDMAKADDTAANSGKFGQNNSTDYNWFSGGVDNTLWNGSSKGTGDPCPDGWRVPTEAELNAITSTKEWTTTGGPSSDQAGYLFGTSPNQVFLPAAGIRGCNYGDTYARGVYGYYWSSSVNDDDARCLEFYDGYSDMQNNYRAYGYSVRCVKE